MRRKVTNRNIPKPDIMHDSLVLSKFINGVMWDGKKETARKIVYGAFDVIKEKNMYGKKVLGIERSTFVFSEDGQLLKEYRKVKAQGHAAQVLQDLKSIE